MSQEPAKRRRPLIAAPWSPLLFWAGGLIAVFWPMLRSGLRLTHGGLGDARLINYILEHGYRWLTGYPLHRSFWSPPVFHPHPNVSAYTDLLLGYGPCYWIWRLVGVEPDTSFQLWMLTVWSLNFLVAYWLLRRCLSAGRLAASCGAWLVAFGNPVQSKFGHPQLAPLFYTLLAVLALCQAFRAAGRRQAVSWTAVALGALVLQFHSAVYPFYFLALGMGAAALWSLAFEDSRRRLRSWLTTRWPAVVVLTVLAGLALLPAAAHYLETTEEIGLHPFRLAKAQPPAAWIWMGTRNLVYGELRDLALWQGIDRAETTASVGLLTLALSLWGLWKGRSLAVVRLVALGAFTVLLLATRFGDFSLWQWVHRLLPGAAALRALPRVGMVALLPAAFGLTLAAQELIRRRKILLLALLLPLVLAEQLTRQPWLNKLELRSHVREVAAEIDPTWDAFLLVDARPKGRSATAEDAAWAGLAAGVPTINGRYGRYPPGYRLRRPEIRNPGDRARLRRELERWIDRHGLDREAVGWVEYQGWRGR